MITVVLILITEITCYMNVIKIENLVRYLDAIDMMDKLVAAIIHARLLESRYNNHYLQYTFNSINDIGELSSDMIDYENILMLEHEHSYTIGASGSEIDIDSSRLKTIPAIIHTARGGKVTYHGPGQLIVYPVIDLRARNMNLTAYIDVLHQSVIQSMSVFGITACVLNEKDKNIGVWVDVNSIFYKIAFIGLKIRAGVAYHGVSINVSPDLIMFDSIVPCGIKVSSITSLYSLGINCSVHEFADVFIQILLFNINNG
jgi:lipoyl(octanoyl) transferase